MGRDPESILVLRLGGIGEVLAITPALRAVRERYPKARITLLAERPACEVASEFVDEIVAANAPYRAHGLASLLQPRLYSESIRLAERLLRGRYDCFLDFHHLFAWRHAVKPLIVSLLSRAPRRIGFSRGDAGFFLTDPVADPDDLPMVERCRAVLAALDIELRDSKPSYRVAAGDLAWVDALGLGNPMIALSPGSSRPVTRWRIERFVETARRLSGRGTVLSIGTKEERALCGEIPGRNFAGETTLGQAAALLQRSALLITNDSGPLHLAVAVGTSVIGIFRPLEYRRWGAYAESPRFRGFYREGPGAQNGETLDQVSVDEVVSAAERMLHENSTRS